MLSASTLQKLIVILLAIFSVLVTLLITLWFVARQQQPAAPPSDFVLELREAGSQPATTSQAGAAGASEGGELPVIFQSPTFELVDQTGQRFGSAQLQGQVWVACFFFTSCQGPCPRIIAALSGLHQVLQGHPRWEELRLVSFSVDPETDTPEVLAEYAKQQRAEDERWKFVTGEKEKVWPLIEEGFKLPVGEDPDTPAMPIYHSSKFVLIDAQGQVRGLYNALDHTERMKLLADIDRLLPPPVRMTP